MPSPLSDSFIDAVAATFFILKRPLTNPGAWKYQSIALAGEPPTSQLCSIRWVKMAGT